MSSHPIYFPSARKKEKWESYDVASKPTFEKAQSGKIQTPEDVFYVPSGETSLSTTEAVYPTDPVV